MECWSNGNASGRIIFSPKPIIPMLHDYNAPIGAKPLSSLYFSGEEVVIKEAYCD